MGEQSGKKEGTFSTRALRTRLSYGATIACTHPDPSELFLKRSLLWYWVLVLRTECMKILQFELSVWEIHADENITRRIQSNTGRTQDTRCSNRVPHAQDTVMMTRRGRFWEFWESENEFRYDPKSGMTTRHLVSANKQPTHLRQLTMSMRIGNLVTCSFPEQPNRTSNSKLPEN